MVRRTRIGLLSALVAMLTLVGGGMAEASNSWNGYKWATADGVVDLRADVSDVQGEWAQVTGAVIADWDNSARINLNTSPDGKQGVVTVRSDDYGATGWLGIAMVSLEGGRITSGRVLLNDWYWSRGLVEGLPPRQHVLCQEMGHTFGLDHQSQSGRSCMNDHPSELGRWVRPNAHDYEQLDAIYRHPDGYDSGTLEAGSGNPRRARAAHNWMAVHAFPAPDDVASGWVAGLGQVLASLPVVSVAQR